MIQKLILVPLVALTAFSEIKTSEELKFSSNGVGLAIHTKSSASRSPLSTTGAITVERDSTPYRIVLDRENRPLFAYELELRESGPNLVRVTIRPASQEKLRKLDLLKGKVTGEVPTIAAARAFPPLRLGDEVHVDIMYNPRTGEKLWDVLRVAPEAQPMAKTGKVFTGPQFSWEGVKIAIGDKVVADRAGSWMIGEAILLKVPGRGDYYLALKPSAGFPFQPSGWVDRNVLRFHANGEQVEVTGRSNLLMKSETGRVWVYHVPEAQSKEKAATVEITCSGDVDLLMHPERQKD